MYEIDQNDRVEELTEIPQSSIGAPIPVVLASEHKVAVAYYCENREEGWDGVSIKMINPFSSREPIAIVVFDRCTSHYFGPPNDEAFSGHPLAEIGLEPYGSFEVIESSWIRKLEQMNSVHPYHNKVDFMHGKRHFILTFHDSIFECVAKGFDIHTGHGSIERIIPKMAKLVL